MNELINELDLIHVFIEKDYTRIEIPNVEVVTQKAALINGKWIPKSQLRTDMDGNLYVTNWLYGKLF